MKIDAEIGKSEGRTRYSEFAERLYEKHRADRSSLTTGEYTAVFQGYLRVYSLIGECNLFLAAVRDIEIRDAIKTYLRDSCYPNFIELKQFFINGGYRLPVTEDDLKGADEVIPLTTDSVNDRAILLSLTFIAKDLMHLWDMGAEMCERTDVKDAFGRNFHRDNRWSIAFHDIALRKDYINKLPTMDAAGLFKTAVGG